MSDSYETLRDSSLDELKSYMDSLDPNQGRKLAYWVRDYAHFLSLEHSFQPEKLIRYKRGSIVKVHLGYRIGCEEGGLHYAIVMDRNNTPYDQTVTIIPLTSIKPNTDLSKLHRTKVCIGNEVYELLTSKLNSEIASAFQRMNEINDALTSENAQVSESELSRQINDVKNQIKYCKKMQSEVDHMKQGSIALVNQITTVSKLRIYDPKYNSDALSRIRVSASTLDSLDEKVQQLFGSPRV